MGKWAVLVLLVALGFSVQALALDGGGSIRPPSDTVQVNACMAATEVARFIESQVAEKGPGVWAAALAEQKIKMLPGVLVGVVLMLGALVWSLIWRRFPLFNPNGIDRGKEPPKGFHFKDAEVRRGVVMIGPIVAALIGLFVIGCEAVCGLRPLLNPEWHAVKDIVTLVFRK
jgi:hypothetical protein